MLTDIGTASFFNKFHLSFLPVSLLVNLRMLFYGYAVTFFFQLGKSHIFMQQTYIWLLISAMETKI